MPTQIPLSDALLSEVNARVAYQLIVLHYRNFPALYEVPHLAVSMLSAHMGRAGLGTVSFWLLAYQVRIAEGQKVKDARDEMIARSRAGHTFRAVAFTPYKANRRRS
jgi:hypothetical protein